MQQRYNGKHSATGVVRQVSRDRAGYFGQVTKRGWLRFGSLSEKVFVSQERVSGFPEKGADLRGSPGTSREVWGTSGEVWETSGEPLDCC